MRELTEDDKETIYLSLLHLGVVRWTKSSRRMEYAMRYVIQHDDIQNMQVIELYVDVAKMDRCKWKAVERSLRYMLNSMWKDYESECAMLFYHSATPVQKPTMAQFLYIYKQEYERGNIRKWNNSIAIPLFSSLSEACHFDRLSDETDVGIDF